MEKAWLQAFGKMTYGLYVLTTSHGTEINGMIASWVSQVSYAPPMLMAAVHPNRYSHRLVEQSGHFVLQALARTQIALVGRFKGADPLAKFDSIEWFRGETGCPVLKDCIAFLECRVVDTYRPGNHSLFVGEVLEAQVQSEGELLTTLDYDGFYVGSA